MKNADYFLINNPWLTLKQSNMSKQLLLGDEAIAQAALDAGLSGVYAYPGTPSTEITEYIQMAPITKSILAL